VASRLDGTYFENRYCEVACPCSASNLALPATYERCHLAGKNGHAAPFSWDV